MTRLNKNSLNDLQNSTCTNYDDKSPEGILNNYADIQDYKTGFRKVEKSLFSRYGFSR